MLASVLPGLRDFRTPFVAGALYALALWLWLGGDRIRPDKHPENAAMRRLTSLADLLGPSATTAAIGLGVYLLGTLLTREDPLPFARWLPSPTHTRYGDRAERFKASRLGRRFARTAFAARMRAWFDRAEQREIYQPKRQWSDDFDRWVSDQSYLATAFLPGGDTVPPDWRPPPPPLEEAFAEVFEHAHIGSDRQPFYSVVLRSLDHAIRVGLELEFDDLVVRLQIERESLFNEFDRLRSEAALRFSIVLPLLLVIAALASVGHPAWLVGVALPAWFYVRGVRVYQQARLRVWQAVKSKVVTSSTLESLDTYLAMLEDLGAKQTAPAAELS